MVKISYAICVCNEHREIESLVNFLLKTKDEEDEVNILLDSGKATPEVRAVLDSYGDKVVVNEREKMPSNGLSMLKVWELVKFC